MPLRSASRIITVATAPLRTSIINAAPRTSGSGGQKQKFNGNWKFSALAGAGALAVTAAIVSDIADCSGDTLHPPHYPWKHAGLFDKFDSSSIRRGHHVFKQVCATCHGLSLIAYRNLIGVSHTEAEAKAIAEEAEYADEPNDQGEVGTRPGKLSDYIKSPYNNEAHARFANNGAYPPDLSIIVKGRPGFADYIYALLLGYRDPPAGVVLRDGLYYNPYFPGGAIGMARQIFDGGVEYEDGTEATAAQMAKDVTTFLAWTSEPESDERKLMGLKCLLGVALASIGAAYFKRFRWSVVKTKKLQFVIE